MPACLCGFVPFFPFFVDFFPHGIQSVCSFYPLYLGIVSPFMPPHFPAASPFCILSLFCLQMEVCVLDLPKSLWSYMAHFPLNAFHPD